MLFDGFRNLTMNAEMMQLSECGQTGDGLVSERYAGMFTTREDVANLTTMIEPTIPTLMTKVMKGVFFCFDRYDDCGATVVSAISS